MDTKKWLYFAKQADEVNLNGIDDVACLPAENLISIAPSANNRVTLKFKSVKQNGDRVAADTVILETIVGDAFEVANEIVRYINSGQPTDGFITIADDTVTTDSAVTALADLNIPAIYAHPSITGVDSINIGTAYILADSAASDLHVGLGTSLSTGANDALLPVNQLLKMDIAGARDYRIPSAADGRAGDWIDVLYTAAMTGGVAHTYTSLVGDFLVGSVLRVPSGEGARESFIDVSVSGDNVLTFTGLAEGDGGIGTRVRFINRNGKAGGWAVHAVLESQGNSTAATADSVFA